MAGAQQLGYYSPDQAALAREKYKKTRERITDEDKIKARKEQFQATATQRLQLQCPGAPKAWPTQVEQRHIGPFRCQGAGTGPADSTRRPGDQSPLSLQPHDRLSLAIPPKPSKFRPTCPTRGVLAAYGLGL